MVIARKEFADHILSAAHCFVDVRPQDVVAYLGEVDRADFTSNNAYAVSDVEVNAAFNLGTFENDIYLLVTSPRMTDPGVLERMRELALDLSLNEYAAGTLSPFALRLVKASFHAHEDGFAGIQQLAHDANLLFYGSEEAQEGRDAYREKRPPDFSRFPRRP